MVFPGVTVVESARILAVQVAHAVGEVRERRLDQQVVVVAEQAASVQAPAVAPAHSHQDLREGGSVGVVLEDRVVVVPFRDDVVVRAFFEVPPRSSHVGDRSAGMSPQTPTSAF